GAEGAPERWPPGRGPRSGRAAGPGRRRRWSTDGTGRGGSPYRACMPDPAYTHGYSDAVLGSHRHRTAENSAAHLLPRLRAGMRLLDVGSGAGTITADLARLVGPEHLTALEVSEQAAAITRAELRRQDLPQVRIVVGDAHDLPFASAEFDVVHAHQVLQHVTNPAGVLG